jgi:hypothetical protein
MDYLGRGGRTVLQSAELVLQPLQPDSCTLMQREGRQLEAHAANSLDVNTNHIS